MVNGCNFLLCLFFSLFFFFFSSLNRELPYMHIVRTCTVRIDAEFIHSSNVRVVWCTGDKKAIKLPVSRDLRDPSDLSLLGLIYLLHLSSVHLINFVGKSTSFSNSPGNSIVVRGWVCSAECSVEICLRERCNRVRCCDGAETRLCWASLSF